MDTVRVDWVVNVGVSMVLDDFVSGLAEMKPNDGVAVEVLGVFVSGFAVMKPNDGVAVEVLDVVMFMVAETVVLDTVKMRPDVKALVLEFAKLDVVMLLVADTTLLELVIDAESKLGPHVALSVEGSHVRNKVMTVLSLVTIRLTVVPTPSELTPVPMAVGAAEIV